MNISNCPHTVVTWACHPALSWIPVVLKNEGFSVWWFQSHAACRSDDEVNRLIELSFVTAFEPVFRGRIIETRDHSGQWMDRSKIWGIIHDAVAGVASDILGDDWVSAQAATIGGALTSVDLAARVGGIVAALLPFGERVEQNIVMKVSGSAVALATNSIVSVVVRESLTNAIVYSRKRSDIVIEVQGKVSGCSIIVTNPSRDIPLEEFENLFCRGFRGREARRLSSNGTGMGLDLIKRCMELVGGSVAIANEHGLFRVTLNFRPAATPTPHLDLTRADGHRPIVLEASATHRALAMTGPGTLTVDGDGVRSETAKCPTRSSSSGAEAV
jgi:hypothetical protein